MNYLRALGRISKLRLTKHQRYPTVDFHVHLGVDRDGKSLSPHELRRMMRSNRIDFCIVFPFNPPTSFSEANDFIMQACKKNKQLIGFARVDPNDPNCLAEIDRCVKNGLRGLKLHMRAQQFQLKDAINVIELCSNLKIPIIFHSPHKEGLHARQAAELAPSFPEIPLIMGHAAMGDKFAIDAASNHPNLFLEISLNPKHKIEQMIVGAGADKILFGSDSPYGNQREMLERVLSIEWLEEEDRRKILGENAMRLLRI